jgi:hypothetical protein
VREKRMTILVLDIRTEEVQEREGEDMIPEKDLMTMITLRFILRIFLLIFKRRI